MNNRFVEMKVLLTVLLLLGVSVSGSALAANQYRVSAQVFSLGELIAQPVMVIEEGRTASVSYSVPGEAQYKFVILIRPAADDQVSISLQFSSGKINLQPNLLVEINKQTSIKIDNTRMTLLVQRESDPMSQNQSLTGTSWWVEDIAGKGVIDSSHTTIEFTDDGRVVGSTGCNRYFGSVEINGSGMTVGPLAGTRKMCPSALMDQETKFFQAMGKVSLWEIAGTGLLHLRNADGSDQIRASRTDDP